MKGEINQERLHKRTQLDEEPENKNCIECNKQDPPSTEAAYGISVNSNNTSASSVPPASQVGLTEMTSRSILFRRSSVPYFLKSVWAILTPILLH